MLTKYYKVSSSWWYITIPNKTIYEYFEERELLLDPYRENLFDY